MSKPITTCEKCGWILFMNDIFRERCPKCAWPGPIKVPKAANPEKTEPIPADPVNAPSHYRQGGIECIDAIRAALTPVEYRGYLKGTALAYLWRERHKNGHEDCRKAGWYVERLVQAGQQEGTETTERQS